MAAVVLSDITSLENVVQLAKYVYMPVIDLNQVYVCACALNQYSFMHSTQISGFRM